VACAEIPSAGHSPAVDNPDRTVQVLVDFWTSVDSSVDVRVGS
jgi:pimeloyl-ACP methyl ester carboxylesterase